MLVLYNAHVSIRTPRAYLDHVDTNFLSPLYGRWSLGSRLTYLLWMLT